MFNNTHILVDDEKEGEEQFQRRQTVNENIKKKDQLSRKEPEHGKIQIGDLVFLKQGMSKSRAREEYLVVDRYEKKRDNLAKIEKIPETA